MKTKKTQKATNDNVAKPATILGLRTCSADMTSHGGFRWPESGPVSCPDWNPQPTCGGGLHFLPWGEGDGELLDWSIEAKWLVIEAEVDKIVNIDDKKSKAPCCNVVFCGSRFEATDYIAKNGGYGRAIHGGTATAGDEGTATAGNYGTATAGNYGTATAGNYGTATAGNYGTATAGDEGTATAGYKGTATAGDEGTATAGDEGTIMIKFWDGNRWRVSIGYIGENGLLSKVAYRLDSDGKFVEVKNK